VDEFADMVSFKIEDKINQRNHMESLWQNDNHTSKNFFGKKPLSDIESKPRHYNDDRIAARNPPDATGRTLREN
jgi:hypothetical protein